MQFRPSLCIIVIACFVGAYSHVRTYSPGPRTIYLYPGNSHNYSDLSTTTLAYDDDDDGSGSDESHNYQYESMCPPEPFRHYFIKGSGRGKKLYENEWKSARVDEFGSLRKLCLLPNGTSVVRRCIQEYQFPEWEDISHWGTIECLGETRQPTITDDLNELHVEMMKTPKHLNVTNVTRMNTIFKRPHKVLPADVQLTGNIFKSLRDAPKSSEISKSMLTACDSLMETESHSAVVSAAKTGATNDLVQSFEQYIDDAVAALDSLNNCVAPTQQAAAGAATNSTSVEDVDYSHLGIRAHLSNHISVFYVNPLCANVTGIAIYERTARSAPHDARHFHEHANFSYRFVRMDESLEVLMSEPGLQLATFIPTSLWQHIKAKFHSYYLRLQQPVVVLKIYSHDGLFVENSPLQTRKPHSKILSISLPDQYVVDLPENIPFLLRNEDVAATATAMTATHVESFASATSVCGYWNYSTWDDRGVVTLNKTAEVIICGTKHLTQFSFLLGGSYRTSDVSDDVVITALSQRALDVISLIGCTLSLLGLLAIWLTALLFPKWRSQGPTKVLLNLCLALTLQMILFLVVQTEDVTEYLVSRSSYVPCLMLGALMQYSILVLFTWMLIIACLQFQRYVIVLGIQRPRHYILKSALIAWLMPLLPVVLVASIDPESYRPPDSMLVTNNAICYPNGAGLTFGVVVPVAIIVMANLFIFIYVSYSVATQLRQVEQRNERKMFMQQVRLSVMLFFLLGLSWIFGIFAFMQAGVVFSYLFCLTATMQGFVLFIYFVVMNAETRGYWRQLFTGKKAADKSKSSELQSMSTSTTRSSSKKNHK